MLTADWSARCGVWVVIWLWVHRKSTHRACLQNFWIAPSRNPHLLWETANILLYFLSKNCQSCWITRIILLLHSQCHNSFCMRGYIWKRDPHPQTIPMHRSLLLDWRDGGMIQFLSLHSKFLTYQSVKRKVQWISHEWYIWIPWADPILQQHQSNSCCQRDGQKCQCLFTNGMGTTRSIWVGM